MIFTAHVNEDDVQDRIKFRLKAIMARRGNQKCCDCSDPKPSWAILIIPPPCGIKSVPENCPMIGAFTCFACAAIHRSLGNDTCQVKCCSDIWTEAEVKAVERGGNIRTNSIFEAEKIYNCVKPTPTSETSTKMEFIQEKYASRTFFDGSRYIACMVERQEGRNGNYQTQDFTLCTTGTTSLQTSSNHTTTTGSIRPKLTSTNFPNNPESPTLSKIGEAMIWTDDRSLQLTSNQSIGNTNTSITPTIRMVRGKDGIVIPTNSKSLEKFIQNDEMSDMFDDSTTTCTELFKSEQRRKDAILNGEETEQEDGKKHGEKTFQEEANSKEKSFKSKDIRDDLSSATNTTTATSSAESITIKDLTRSPSTSPSSSFSELQQERNNRKGPSSSFRDDDHRRRRSPTDDRDRHRGRLQEKYGDVQPLPSRGDKSNRPSNHHDSTRRSSKGRSSTVKPPMSPLYKGHESLNLEGLRSLTSSPIVVEGHRSLRNISGVPPMIPPSSSSQRRHQRRQSTSCIPASLPADSSSSNLTKSNDSSDPNDASSRNDRHRRVASSGAQRRASDTVICMEAIAEASRCYDAAGSSSLRQRRRHSRSSSKQRSRDSNEASQSDGGSSSRHRRRGSSTSRSKRRGSDSRTDKSEIPKMIRTTDGGSCHSDTEFSQQRRRRTSRRPSEHGSGTSSSDRHRSERRRHRSQSRGSKSSDRRSSSRHRRSSTGGGCGTNGSSSSNWMYTGPTPSVVPLPNGTTSSRRQMHRLSLGGGQGGTAAAAAAAAAIAAGEDNYNNQNNALTNTAENSTARKFSSATTSKQRKSLSGAERKKLLDSLSQLDLPLTM